MEIMNSGSYEYEEALKREEERVEREIRRGVNPNLFRFPTEVKDDTERRRNE